MSWKNVGRVRNAQSSVTSSGIGFRSEFSYYVLFILCANVQVTLKFFFAFERLHHQSISTYEEKAFLSALCEVTAAFKCKIKVWCQINSPYIVDSCSHFIFECENFPRDAKVFNASFGRWITGALSRVCLAVILKNSTKHSNKTLRSFFDSLAIWGFSRSQIGLFSVIT